MCILSLCVYLHLVFILVATEGEQYFGGLRFWFILDGCSPVVRMRPSTSAAHCVIRVRESHHCLKHFLPQAFFRKPILLFLCSFMCLRVLHVCGECS